MEISHLWLSVPVWGIKCRAGMLEPACKALGQGLGTRYDSQNCPQPTHVQPGLPYKLKGPLASLKALPVRAQAVNEWLGWVGVGMGCD